jgi:hypothetical protein
MGRLDSPSRTSRFSIKIKATAGSDSEEIVLAGGATLKCPEFLEIEARSEELLQEPDTAYILRIGDIKLHCETNICVMLEISGDIDGLVKTAGINLTCSFFIGSNSNTVCLIEYALGLLSRIVLLFSLLNDKT